MMTLICLYFFCGSWVFCSNRKHLLITLLSLEFIVLVIYVLLYMFLVYMDYELYFVVIYLTFSVCEGALGLSILVSLVRGYGNDYFYTFSMLQC
uniref:NADH dehydrogenase subunit 4L n=1 Tax=Chorisoserrata biceps TaxID=3037039 RepID=UPI00279F03E0|nr:NADH dehydrogenase subunit 4L [Chorisoserrata biceps]WGO57193.1 NADH dehydrogenase subunit 4L [Chorisoserrata biceps]